MLLSLRLTSHATARPASAITSFFDHQRDACSGRRLCDGGCATVRSTRLAVLLAPPHALPQCCSPHSLGDEERAAAGDDEEEGVHVRVGLRTTPAVFIDVRVLEHARAEPHTCGPRQPLAVTLVGQARFQAVASSYHPQLTLRVRRRLLFGASAGALAQAPVAGGALELHAFRAVEGDWFQHTALPF
eukprot:2431559-Rhodomonas_salina.1